MRRAVPLLLLAMLAACAEDAPSTATAVTPPSSTSLPTDPENVDAPTSSTAPTSAADPSTSTPPGGATSDVVVPEGFERVRATVTEPDGTECELCLWLADDNERRRRGLMFVTDLGEADGMAFAYPEPHTGTFWMKNTLLPLSIAFFSPTGEYLDAFDMEPCREEPCRQYPTPSDFLVAIETTRGDLPQLGIGPGSVLDLTDLPCDDVTAG